jgi:predicted transcriptional regulator
LNPQVASREEAWQAIKNFLDIITRRDTIREGERKPDMALLEELTDRVKELKAEIEELDKRRRILASRVAVLERAIQAETENDLDYLDEEHVVSKAEIVRHLIRDSGEKGITVAEIRAELEKQGQTLSRNFAYSTIARLKEDKEIVKKATRYFWKVRTTA